MCVERSGLASCADDVVYSYISNAMNAFCFAFWFDREFLGSLELGAWTTIIVLLPCPSLSLPSYFHFHSTELPLTFCRPTRLRRGKLFSPSILMFLMKDAGAI